MALISGDELAQALQATNPDLLILLMSGSADDAVLNRLTPGTSAFLAKPFRPSEFIEQIQHLLGRRRDASTHPSPP
jgi:FixJ family two-component response regulator